MSTSAAVYVIQRGMQGEPHVHLALRRLRDAVDRLLVVTDADNREVTHDAVSHLVPDSVIACNRANSTLSGYRQGLQHLRATGGEWGPVIVTGSHVFGPIRPAADYMRDMQAGGAHLFAAYWHNSRLDPRLKDRKVPGRIAHLDFAILSPALLARDDVWSFWGDLPAFRDYWDEMQRGLAPFTAFLEDASLAISYPFDDGDLETIDPQNFEVHKLVEHGAPCIPASVFMLDPLLHDLNAIDLRRALDMLRIKAPELYRTVVRFAVKRLPPRDFNTISDQYEVLSDVAADAAKDSWSFGRIAVFIHAFYADMMPEFWELLQRIPCDMHLFLTTASADDKARIEAFLADKGFPAADTTVRVVEQNRGRDMSSLFITFRDVVMSGEYEVALRLHSKRTPQVSRRVGENFKDYLFDNLVHGPGYVANLLDKLEAEPDIGLVIPPVIHIGFGTLGHSWFNNRRSLERIASDMGLDVKLDAHTPVAPNGTMYWFRTAALKQMFAWKWRWGDYNPEPHHIDGGLAHIQERLIGYCVQDRGYRILSVMTPRQAGRNYAKLEYKMQLVSSYLASGNIMDQRRQLDVVQGHVRARLFTRMRDVYGRILTRFPASRRMLRPFARAAVYLLAPSSRR